MHIVELRHSRIAWVNCSIFCMDSTCFRSVAEGAGKANGVVGPNAERHKVLRRSPRLLYRSSQLGSRDFYLPIANSELVVPNVPLAA